MRYQTLKLPHFHHSGLNTMLHMVFHHNKTWISQPTHIMTPAVKLKKLILYIIWLYLSVLWFCCNSILGGYILEESANS